ncbi:MAG: hypothetical protein DMF46_00420 [Verrucomicrobia bacterium]|nr:MAG: hypothetical protein DMF46_00420 [Verrucomicrobiota bacterium]
MYIGGISYFSSGSGKRPLGGVCPEAAASPDSKTNQIKKRVLDTIKHLKLKRVTVYQNAHAASIKFLAQNRPRSIRQRFHWNRTE